jgi:hypothetical protein
MFDQRPVLPLLAGAGIGLAGVVALPDLTGSELEQLSVIAENGNRFLAGNLLTFVGVGLIGFGLLSLARRCRSHGHPRAGAVLMVAGFGWIVHMALIAHNAVSYELAQLADRDVAAQLAEDIYAGPVFLGILLPMLLMSVVGTTVGAVALWRVSHAPVWAAGAIVVGLVSDMVLPDSIAGVSISGVPMFVLLLAGFGGLARAARIASAQPLPA